jgi:hypothetical protein
MKTYRTAVGIATLVLLLGACGEPETNEDEEEATIAAPPGEVAAGPHDTESEESEESGDDQALEEAVALASGYLEARNAYDVEGARQLVADEFLTDEPPDGYINLATMEPAFELHQAFGFRFSEVECVPRQGTVTRLVVVCDYLLSTETRRIGGYAPSPAELRVYVKDGRIFEVLRGSETGADSWGPFEMFVREHDPAFRQVMDRGLQLEPEAHRELVERLPEVFQRYEQWLDEQDNSPGLAVPAEEFAACGHWCGHALDARNGPVSTAGYTSG